MQAKAASKAPGFDSPARRGQELPAGPRLLPQRNPFFSRSNSASAESTPAPAKTASLPPAVTTDAVAAQHAAQACPKKFVVVLDPGHGGKDPGAVSADGKLKEKDVTLAVAKRLQRLLRKKMPSVTVALTREDDRFLSLQERTELANRMNADIFVSLHCNGTTDSVSRGIETFYLSKSSSPRARRIAARENGIPLSKMSDLEATLLNLMVTAKTTESDALAKEVHSSIIRTLKRHASGGRDRGVRRAPFYVLLGATMPAILVECAFISSSRERDKLTSGEYLDSIAGGLAEGTLHYLQGLGDRG